MPALAHRFVFLALIALLGASGCKSLRTPQENAETRLHVYEFMQQLSSLGITAKEEGPARAGTITSTFGERLLLNERDLVDVYFFRDEEQARKESNVAENLSQYDVYYKDTVLLYHIRTFDPAVRNVLEDLFGLPK